MHAESDSETIGLTERDRRVMGLMAEHGFNNTSEQEIPDPDLHPDAGGVSEVDRHLEDLQLVLGNEDREPCGITVQACTALHAVYGAGATYDEIHDETGLSKSTISQHINGECSHKMLCRRRCNAIRAARWDGKSFYKIRNVLNIGKASTLRHAEGECPHVGGVEIAPQDRDG